MDGTVKVQITVHALLQRLKQNSTFNHENDEILDSETSADMFLYVIMEPFMSQSSVIP
jgi:hypothetical protein